MSIEALAMLGVDYRNVEVQVLQDKPWPRDLTKIDDGNWRQLKENAEIFDHRPDENARMKKRAKSELFGSIEFGKDMDHFQNGESIGKGDDEDDEEKRMKIKLREWARAMASYVILLDAAFKHPSPGVT